MSNFSLAFDTSTTVTAPPAPPPRPVPKPSPMPSEHGSTSKQGSYMAMGDKGSDPDSLRLGDCWLPDTVKDKTTLDLQELLANPQLQQALVNCPATAHPSVPLSVKHIESLLDSNMALAGQLVNLEQQIGSARQQIQSRLLALRALDRQWQAKQVEQDQALADFSASTLYQKLNAAGSEQDMLCKAMEESFFDDHGVADDRQVGDFIKRIKEARQIAYLRKERKERWDEGRIGGWKG